MTNVLMLTLRLQPYGNVVFASLFWEEIFTKSCMQQADVEQRMNQHVLLAACDSCRDKAQAGSSGIALHHDSRQAQSRQDMFDVG